MSGQLLRAALNPCLIPTAATVPAQPPDSRPAADAPSRYVNLYGMTELPVADDVLAAAARISGHASVTPVLQSRALDAMAGC